MRHPFVYLCSVLSVVSIAGAQDAVVDPAADAAQAAPTPIAIEAPADQPSPIEPVIDTFRQVDELSQSVSGTVDQPISGPVPAIPGTVAPPSATPATTLSTTTTAAGRIVNEFQNEDVGAVIRLLARQAGVNVVVSDQVVGTITMRLENLTPMEALRVVVTAKGLLLDQQESVFYIKTAAERQKEPTISGHYTFSYAKADEVRALLATQIQSGVAPQVDIRTNTIYYRDFKSNLENVELFLESIDRPTQQVMIEARLVEVNANPRQSYGINWGGVVGNSSTPQTFTYGGLNNVDIPGLDGGTTATLGDLLYRTNGQDAWKTVYGQFAILSVPQMTATLRFLNEDADAEFLANPRVVTANNLEARIEITRNQPVPQLNFNEQTATAVFGGFEDKTFGNELVVRPTINKDDYVTMLVKPKISNKVGDARFELAGAQVASPIIDTRALESTVLIRSGDTLAIGGLLQDETSKNRNKVPFLGDIPILGYAFQERTNARTKRNLLVFVTPTIVRQGYGTGLEDQVSGLKSSGEEYADPNGWRNNARGAIRLVPTSNRPVSADYPKPGMAPEPAKAGNYKVSAPGRER
ncbi:MAG TPA: hypothetical protein VNQ90_18700 [Chthoniobacteraceae bacterium]|nr:hypothetical protein [Chthoniobacteraceae bacterium]